MMRSASDVDCSVAREAKLNPSDLEPNQSPKSRSGGSQATEEGLQDVLERIHRLTQNAGQTPQRIVPRSTKSSIAGSSFAASAATAEAYGNNPSQANNMLRSTTSDVYSIDSPDQSPPPAPGIPRYLRVTSQREEPMIPLEPTSLIEAGVTETLIQEIIMRYLFNRGEAVGRAISDQLKLSFGLIEPTLLKLKSQQFIAYSGATAVNDYNYVLTDAGRDRALRFMQKTTYFGAAPVSFSDYVISVKLQSVEFQHPTREDLRKAFSDLLVPPALLAKLGPAINSGRGMFLFGYPGNGKTSIAERVTKTFGDYIWIPRCVIVEGDIIRIYDPMMHELVDPESENGLLDKSQFDRRWVRIRRPTIVAGGELTMSMLEVAHNPESKICDSPLQVKSNCGVLLIDDFGRQRMTVDELLNRWIVPLEKRYDYLSLPSGKKIQIPFDQLVIFSTNLEPKKLVDDAFLRRIPYKIEVENPNEEAFKKLFEIMCRVLKVPYYADMVDYLISKHYRPINRPFRNCHPRDLLLQVRSYCYYNAIPMDLKPEYLDFAVENYFSIM